MGVWQPTLQKDLGFSRVVIDFTHNRQHFSSTKFSDAIQHILPDAMCEFLKGKSSSFSRQGVHDAVLQYQHHVDLLWDTKKNENK